MNLFKKVIGTQCLGQVDPACPNYVNKTLLPPHKRYDECGSPMREMTATNYATVIALVATVVAIVGGSGVYVYYRVHRPAIATSKEIRVSPVAEKPEPPLEQKVDDAILTIAFKNGVGYASNRMYENAVKEFATVERSKPDYPSLQMNMGASYLQLKQYDRAREHLLRAQQQTPDDPKVLYNLACLAAATGKRTEAIEQLRAAVDHGFRDVAALKSDSDLASIRSHEDFAAIVKAASHP